MPKVLREAEVDAYRRNGYHFPVDVLSADEVAGFRGKLEDYEAASGDLVRAQHIDRKVVTVAAVAIDLRLAQHLGHICLPLLLFLGLEQA